MNEDLRVTSNTTENDIQDVEPTAPGNDASVEDSINQEYMLQYADDLQVLVASTKEVNQRLDTMTNCMIVGMVGIALVVGILACSIFGRYFRT